MSAAAGYGCEQFVEDVTAYLDGALPAEISQPIDEAFQERSDHPDPPD